MLLRHWDGPSLPEFLKLDLSKLPGERTRFPCLNQNVAPDLSWNTLRRWTRGTSNRSSKGDSEMIRAILYVVSWFLIALGLSVSGWFQQFSPFSIFSIGGVASSLGFAVLYNLEARLRGSVRARNLKRLTYGQMLRFFGVLAFFKAWQHVLPPVFAIPTGLMDVAVAGSSFFIASRFAPACGRPPRVFFVWHIAGLGTIAASNVLVLLTSSPRFGLVEAGVTSQAMTSFPMSLVPTFIGPLVLIFHLLAICDARRQAGLRPIALP